MAKTITLKRKGKGAGAGAVTHSAAPANTKRDPKPKKKIGDAALFDKIPLDKETSAAAKVVAATSTTACRAYVALGMCMVALRHKLVGGGFIQKSEARHYLAYKLFPLLAAASDEAYIGVRFRKPKKTDKPELRKILNRWQGTVTHYDNVGIVASRLDSLGIDVNNDFPAMNISKLRAMFPAWKKAAAVHTSRGKSDPIDLTKVEQAAKANKLLLAIYKKALIATREEIASWNSTADSGPLGSRGDPLDNVPPSKKGASFTSMRKVIADQNAGRYTIEELFACRANCHRLIEETKAAAKTN